MDDDGQKEKQDQRRIEFARHGFDNVQSLIRFMDQKSGFTLVVLALLSAAFVSILGLYFDKGSPLGDERLVVFGAAAVYLLCAVSALSHCLRTIRARPNVLGNHCAAPGMLFPFIIKDVFGLSDARYLDKLKGLECQEMLADYSQQLMENSNIYLEKSRHVNLTLYWLHWIIFPWVAALATIVGHILLKDYVCGCTLPLALGVTLLSVVLLCFTVGIPREKGAPRA